MHRPAVVSILRLLAAGLLATSGAAARGDVTSLSVRPSAADPSVTSADEPHLVMYDPARADAPLLLFLPGTGGIPGKGGQAFRETAVAQGYRVVALSYPDEEAVAGICTVRRGNPMCPAQFRQKRVFGDDVTNLISDKPQDAIVNRFRALLLYLRAKDPGGGWDRYLDGGAVRWDRVAVGGQSQGGGMAAYLAKKIQVARVIEFSGGWDNAGRPGTIASWYAAPSATPESRWFGTYHQLEPNAATIRRTYQASRIPPDHVFALDEPVEPPGAKAHPQGVSNPVYRPIWIRMLTGGT